MFTGIIEEIGLIKNISSSGNYSDLIIECSLVLKDLKIGDSISTNGVCLTVTNFSKNSFTAHAMKETLKCSNLSLLKLGNKVNLERALKANGRFDGHMVSGHIDSIGEIVNIKKDSSAFTLSISANTSTLKYIVYKGSIAIDGVSLTVSYVDDKIFKVCIIPHTGLNTTLLSKDTGDIVNLECDIIPKYLEKLLSHSDLKCQEERKTSINLDFLSKSGFL